MNVLSLFDGMACGLVALKRAGTKVDNYYASEIDKYAIQIAKKNHPEIQHLGDINNYESWVLPKINLIIGGSPCQGFSFAGKQLNFDDPRSVLFFKFVECIENFEPDYFLLENVKMKKQSSNIINNILGIKPILINSTLVSAQDRKRLYWFNWKLPAMPKDKNLFIRDILDDKGIDITDRFYAKIPGTLAFEKSRKQIRKYWEKSRCLLAGPQSISNSGATNVFEPGARYRAFTPIECERLQTIPDNYTSGVSNAQRYKMIGNGWTVDVIKYILEAMPI